ncbi:hypothetical protein [Natronomonas marina]|jgi:flagellar protein FlaF|uniref:hypothetical protein n=1 Tax=Natronomonas marina TaxID=2961939 RepID=UPI0020C98026|nr:hypothetical protein [Natronomonas marina]
MGFSVSGATVVVLVGLLVSTATLYPTLDRSRELQREATDDRAERLLDRQNTAISVENATYNRTSDELTVTLKNDGTTTLSTTRTDLLADGVYRDGATTAVAGDPGREAWTPAETLTFTADLPTAPARVKIVTEGGVSVAATVTEVT